MQSFLEIEWCKPAQPISQKNLLWWITSIKIVRWNLICKLVTAFTHHWGGRMNRFFSIQFGFMKTLFRTTFETFLDDPRVMGQEEQLSCHPLCLIWARQEGKIMIYLPPPENNIFSPKNISRNIWYAFYLCWCIGRGLMTVYAVGRQNGLIFFIFVLFR